MSSASSLIAIFSLILVASVAAQDTMQSNNITCYSCISAESYDGADCSDSQIVAANITTACQINAKGCRKIIQDVGDDFRIIRQCAYEETSKERYCVERAGTKGIKLRFCFCPDSLCNKSTVPSASIFLMISLAGMAGRFFL